ncbi:hypothetical protein VCR15J2_330008 [Vibrio coralliirubri]|nr:hypothetical protein VCR15J2_330008 [Vibrio coralliirubri]
MGGHDNKNAIDGSAFFVQEELPSIKEKETIDIIEHAVA